MALPILDGNQTAATLSTVLTSGEHIPAHTVVSLGSQAITDVRSAVSGSVVSISNFPSTQTIAGAVTANLESGLVGVSGGGAISKGIGLSFNADITGANVQIVASELNPLPVKISAAIVEGDQDFIAVVGDSQRDAGVQIAVEKPDNTIGLVGSGELGVPLPISGTVTANVNRAINNENNFISIAGEGSGDAGIMVGFRNSEGNTNIVGVTEEGGAGPLPISGTVTANNPNGALTTRFGSVTTANTAQITSAVTNTSRKYLLAQNISAGTVTIGIGFSPTTTQGIQLAAGGGLTFDAFCPTGAVYWLGAVTGAAFTILEG